MFVETCNHFGSSHVHGTTHAHTHTHRAKEEGMTSNHRNEDWRDAKMYLENWHENWNNNDWCVLLLLLLFASLTLSTAASTQRCFWMRCDVDLMGEEVKE